MSVRHGNWLRIGLDSGLCSSIRRLLGMNWGGFGNQLRISDRGRDHRAPRGGFLERQWTGNGDSQTLERDDR